MWVVLSGILLGWALGGNDAANVFGPAVSSNILKFWKAAFISAIFIVLGALLEGEAGLETVGKLTGQTTIQAFVCMLSAGLVVVLMTYLKLPVSTSQAVIGSVVGAGLVTGGVHWEGLIKVVVCWIGTPIGAAFVSMILYYLSVKIIKICKINFFELDFILRWGLIFCCIYGAYALGANNVANTTGVFVQAGVLTPFRVSRTVGKSVIPLNGFSALISLLASSITVHFYAKVGVPVSTSQAIVGAVLGIGAVRGFNAVNVKMLSTILVGWLMTPALSILIAAGLLSMK
jgi:PiT family inorganic phosphate transporter